MATNTASYSFNLPTVGGDVDLWGDYLNANWEDVDDLFDGTTPVDGIDIDGGTIDGVSIGGTTPAAGDFTALTATSGTSGAAANSAADELALHSDGDAGLSILTPNTGTGRIYFGDPENNASGRIQYAHGNDSMTLFTGGVQAVRINAIGNVGIRPSGGPTAKLDVAGTIAVTEASAGANCAVKLGLGRTAGGTSSLDLIGDTTYTSYGARLAREGIPNGVTALQHRGLGNIQIVAEDAGGIELATNDTKRFAVSSSGDIDCVEGEISLGEARTTDGFARVLLHGATGGGSADFEISRFGGVNGDCFATQKGTGDFLLRAGLTEASGPQIRLVVGSSTHSLSLNADGEFEANCTSAAITGTLNLSGLPTSSAGLSAGDVWNDSGTLKIV